MASDGTTPTSYTIRQAAEALGVDASTIRRRIREGALSAPLTPKGKAQVRTIDGAELARFAEANGYALKVGKDVARGRSVPGTAQVAAHSQPSAGSGRGPCPNCAVLKATADAQERLIDVLQGEVRFLREQVSALTVARLPAAPSEGAARQSWWARLWGRGGGDEGNGGNHTTPIDGQTPRALG